VLFAIYIGDLKRSLMAVHLVNHPMIMESRKFLCSYFDNNLCRSCSLLEDENRDLALLPKELLLFDSKLKPWVRCSDPYASRAKAKMTVSGTISDPVIGILDKDLQGVELLHCALHKKSINKVISEVKKLIKPFDLTPYSINERAGDLKGLIIQTNKAEDHIRVRFILSSESAVSKCSSLARELELITEQTLSVTCNIQPIPHQIPEGPKEILILGPDLLWEEYETTRIAFPSQSFMQVTPEVASKLYSHAAKIAETYKPDLLVDLFSGAGGFTLSLAPYVEKAVGIEISEEAIRAARLSSSKANLTNISFYQGDLLASMEMLIDLAPDMLLCNPPRRGVGDSVIDALIKIKPRVILYSSCNILSFLADANRLSEYYEIVEITPFEMFPMTQHYEIFSVLVRK